MIESIFALLMTSPVLSICLIFILILVFRKVIIKILIKVYDLHTTEDIRIAVTKSLPSSNIYTSIDGENNYNLDNSLLSLNDVRNLKDEAFINKIIENLKNKKK